MKVIDLLNKIANGEEVPKKIGYDNKIFEFDELERQYTFHNLDYSVNDDLSLSIEGLRYSTLNDEVEIIEDKPFSKRVEEIYNRHIDYINNKEDKKIEKIDRELNCDDDTIRGLVASVNEIYKEIADKINEIIDYINEGDK